MAITTVSAVKTHLGISGSSEDTALTQWVAQVDALIKTYLGRQIEQATYTGEFYSGNGTQVLALRERPVQSITSLYVDNDGFFGYGTDPFASGDLLTAGTDYALARDKSDGFSHRGHVIRIGAVWPLPSARLAGLLAAGPGIGIGNIKITYVAGFASVPADIALAANQMVGVLRKGAASGGIISSQSLDYYSVSFANSTAESQQIMGSVKQLLSKYKEWSL